MNGKIATAFTIICLISAVLPTFLPATTAAKTLTVPNDYPTISAALESAIDGDTINVAPGTYIEHLTINKAITLKGAGSDSTTINGANAGSVIIIQHDNVEVTGFTVKYDKSANTPKSLWMWSTRLAGVHLLGVKNCNIHDNTIQDCGGGLWLYSSSQNKISNNYVYRNDYGIRVESSSGNLFEKNTAVSNWAGFTLYSSPSNTLRSNSFSGNTENFAVTGDNAAFINYVDSSNTVDNKPIYYFIGKSHQTVPPDAGCVIMVDCIDMSVQGLSLTKNHDAITIVNCLNIIVANNSIAQTNGGVTTYGCIGGSITGNTINCINAINFGGDGCQIADNNIVATNLGIGTNGNYNSVNSNTVNISPWEGQMMKCTGSYNIVSDNWLNGTSYTYGNIEGANNFFYGNTMVNCYQLNVNCTDSVIAKNTVTGIFVTGGSNNSICGNRVTNGLGLSVGGHNNSFFANEIAKNYYVGASISGNEQYSSNNILFHNNFIDNKVDVKNIGKNRSNAWDNGVEGNYWTNYNGTDSNGDGIGDTPHYIMTEVVDEAAHAMTLAVTGQDNHPLVRPFDISTVTIEFPHWNYGLPATLTPTATSTQSINQQTSDPANWDNSASSPPNASADTSDKTQTTEPTPNQATNQSNHTDAPREYTVIVSAIVAMLVTVAIVLLVKRK